jgi:Diacylglycerol kinase catalytic domain
MTIAGAAISHTPIVTSDIAVLVNLRARRGSEAVANACRRGLPGARVVASRSLDEALDFARALGSVPPALFVSAGGDGTAMTLINALRGQRAAVAPIGCLRLGTGNGLARITGAPRWRSAIERLGAMQRQHDGLPTRRFDLVEVDGTLAPFAGTGWDAELIDDFHEQKSGVGLVPRRWRNGLSGYLQGLVTRTIPRHLFASKPVEVELINTGADAIGVDDEGRAVPLVGGGHGAVLYRGPVNVCAAGTSGEWGFGFRAFPFCGLVPRRFCMRVYAGSVVEATLRMRSLWRGAHPVPKMHTWMLTGCRAVFSRPVPFQIGGDRVGWRQEVEYTLAAEHVDLLDWRRVMAHPPRAA